MSGEFRFRQQGTGRAKTEFLETQKICNSISKDLQVSLSSDFLKTYSLQHTIALYDLYSAKSKKQTDCVSGY